MLLLLLRIAGTWQPCAIPIQGTYNRVGGIDEPSFDLAASILLNTVEALGAAPRKPQDSDAHAFLEALRQSSLSKVPVVWDNLGANEGSELSYTLVDAGVYRAIAETAANENGTCGAELTRATWPELIERAFPSAVLENYSYAAMTLRAQDREGDPHWRRALIDLIRFRTWKTGLRPVGELDSGQYVIGEPETLAHATKAREKYAEHPRILSAVAANATRWLGGAKAPSALSWIEELPPVAPFDETDGYEDALPAFRFAGEPNHLGVHAVAVRATKRGISVDLGRRERTALISALRKRLIEERAPLTLEGEEGAVRFQPADVDAIRVLARREVLVELSARTASEMATGLEGGAGAVSAIPELRFRPLE